MSDPGEPEDTAPFTHRPYGSAGRDDNPNVSPSGPAAQPSGPTYPAPPSPVPGQQPWQAAWAPVYGAPVAGALDHKGANTSLVLGIVSLVSLLTALFCCVTIPGIVCAPFAWFIGARAKREIEAAPGTYGNVTAAVTGMWMGIVVTILGALVIVGFAAIIAFLGFSGWSLV